MLQPGVIIIGTQFFLKIEEMAVQFPKMCTTESAIAYLISLIYILDVQYPEPLKFVYVFFEHLFEFADTSANFTSVNLLLSKVKPMI